MRQSSRPLRNSLRYGVAIIALAVGCRDATAPSTLQAPEVVSLDLVSGDGQTAVVGTQLASPLVVKVTRNGFPLPLQILNFRVAAGNGSVFAGTAMTNLQGIAKELWTLGTKAGEVQKIEVRAVDANSGAPIVYATFTATGTADVPFRFQAFDPCKDCQTAARAAPLGSLVSDPQGVVAFDKYGNVASGATVTFEVASGGGTLGSPSAVTSADGVASPGTWTLGGTKGWQEVKATAPNAQTFVLRHYAYDPEGLHVGTCCGVMSNGSYAAGTRIGPMYAVVMRADNTHATDQYFEVRWSKTGASTFAPFARGGYFSGAFADIGAGVSTFTGTVAGIGSYTFTQTGI